MKKLLGVVFLLVLAFSCEDIDRPVLDETELRSVLSTDQTYEEINNIAYSNYLALITLESNGELANFFQLAADARTEEMSALAKFASLCNEIKFSAKHIQLIESLKKDLNLKYVFDEKDLNNILESDLIKMIEEHRASNGRIMYAPYLHPCLSKCQNASQEYVKKVGNSTSETIRIILGEAYFAGCFEDCMGLI